MDTAMKDEGKAIIIRFIILTALFAAFFALIGLTNGTVDTGTIAQEGIGATFTVGE